MTRTILGALLMAAGLGAGGADAEPAAAPTTTVTLEGLGAPVEIVVDAWGVAHIYAASEEDLFFAQGYHAAMRRLFQLELWRRQATGTVAEILGRRALDRDIGSRLLRYRGDLRRELSHYHPRGEAIVRAFVRGINARVDQTLRQPELLPIEFRVLGIRPGRWTPEVVISRHQGLMHNAAQELDLGRAVARLGAEKVRELVWFHPGEPDLTLDGAIDGSSLGADILRLYRAARSPIGFRPEDVQPEFRAPRQTRRPGAPAERWSLAERRAVRWTDEGSNNWVIGGARTESGAAIMANDPHRALQAPSLRYFVHLVGPGWNVIGGGEPTLPGVSIGHNGAGAWGLTFFRIDAEDLYAYRTDPKDPLRYRYGDGWEAMTVRRETVAVRGEKPVEVELKFTRHGPVLWADPKRCVAYALRAAWLEPGGAPYLASLRINGAGDWGEFREACRFHHIPGLNMVWADRRGAIGWQVVGIAPLRSKWHGLVPVPGDGRYEWSGYLPGRELPHVLNPPQGFWHTANEYVVPPGYEPRAALGWTWTDPYRGARIREVLAGGRKLNMMDMMRLQHDELSIPARTLVPLLRDLDPGDEAVRRAIGELQGWDFVLDRDSVGAGIYAMWERRLVANMHRRTVPEEVRRAIPALSMKRILDGLLAPDGRFGPDPLAGRDALLLESLKQAVAELRDRFGPERRAWRYGQAGYKHARIGHLLGPAVHESLRSRLDVGTCARGGNTYTVNQAGDSDNQLSGASFRVVIDTGDWDNSVATNAPGQSGDPADPHYRDLFPMWALGRYFPLFYSRTKIESVRRHTLVLTWRANPG